MYKPLSKSTAFVFVVILSLLFLLSSVLSPAAAVQAQDVEPPTPEAQESDEQGGETPDVEGQIVGGIEADPGEWPWQVALVDGNTANFYDGQFCGGSLIDNYWVLTAGHCVTNDNGSLASPSSIDVVAGVHNLDVPTSGYQRRDVVQIVRHPNYNNNTLDHDIALLKLSSPINLGGSGATKTAVIPLASSAMGNWSGSTAWVTGWGSTQPGWPEKLREVSVPVITNTSCNSKYGSGITANMLCAGFDAGGKDACQGDSGGPLVIDRTGSGSWVLAGIVSWGEGCAQPNKPGVYTRVSNYGSWVAGYVDSGPPVVASITRATASPSKLESVDFKVTFSKSVTGVDVDDFDLTTTGVTGASIIGVSGSGNKYMVTVNTGAGNGTIRLDLVDGDSITDASSTPLGGAGTGNGSFSGPTYMMAKDTFTETYQSNAGYDGWVLESSETSNKGGSRNVKAVTLRVGDDAANRQYRSILDFYTTDAPIDPSMLFFKVTLLIKQQGMIGSNPFSALGKILVDFRREFGTTDSLEKVDFQAAPAKANIAQFTSKNSGGWHSVVIGSAHYGLLDRDGINQFRLRFKTDDNNDFLANYISFYSGNAEASNRPQLIIEYYSLP
jgi:hypothetical protein